MKNNFVIHPHQINPPSPDQILRANPNCKWCFGRGMPGKITLKRGNTTIVNNRTCACIIKATQEKVKWLKDQPWLGEKDDSGAKREEEIGERHDS